MDLAAILAFINARLDEREAAARAAGYPDPEHWVREGSSVINTYLRQAAAARTDEAAAHIALNDPRFVLDDVAAKRRIVDELERVADSGHLDGGGRCYDCGVMPEWLLRLLAAPFAQHADFDPAWAVEA